MAEREIEATVEGVTENPEDKELKDFIEQQLAKFGGKKIVAEVYERGVVGDRLHVDLPPELVGQWVPNDAMAVYRMEALGYVVDKKFAPMRRLHDKGDGASYVGDVVHMIAPRQIRDAIDEVKKERYERINGKRGQSKQKEEKDFENQQKQLEGAGIKTINDSKVHTVDSIDEIRRIIDPEGAAKT